MIVPIHVIVSYLVHSTIWKLAYTISCSSFCTSILSKAHHLLPGVTVATDSITSLTLNWAIQARTLHSWLHQTGLSSHHCHHNLLLTVSGPVKTFTLLPHHKHKIVVWPRTETMDRRQAYWDFFGIFMNIMSCLYKITWNKNIFMF